ncbi:MAG TPA: N-formylglutamate amidohydrolase, partial [Novosphingobium capsulatum]|nr:N-formylglutamate amidohydrolase [Novosphingobium capsulatum]
MAWSVSEGGKIPGSGGVPAFVWRRKGLEQHSAPIPLIIAVPHAGRHYPAGLLAAMRQPELAARRLEDRLVDLIGLEVARATGATLLVAQAPRAMIDLNRAPDDIDREMIVPDPTVPVGRLMPRRGGAGGGIG